MTFFSLINVFFLLFLSEFDSVCSHSALSHDFFLRMQGRTRTPSGEACGKETRCTFTVQAWWKRACVRLSLSMAPSSTCPWTRHASMSFNLLISVTVKDKCLLVSNNIYQK